MTKNTETTMPFPLKCTERYPLVPFRPTRETATLYYDGDKSYLKTICIDFEKIHAKSEKDYDDLAEMLAVLSCESDNTEHLEALAHLREVFAPEYLRYSARQLPSDCKEGLKSMIAKLNLV